MPDIFTKGLSTNSRRWRDLDLDFRAHPVTKDIVTKTDVEAIKRSVRNLILTNTYERPFQPEIDCGVVGRLFELATPILISNLQSVIRNTISNFEPRVEVISIDIKSNIDKNGFNVSIVFTAVNTPDPVTVEIFLERLR